MIPFFSIVERVLMAGMDGSSSSGCLICTISLKFISIKSILTGIASNKDYIFIHIFINVP